MRTSSTVGVDAQDKDGSEQVLRKGVLYAYTKHPWNLANEVTLPNVKYSSKVKRVT